MYSTRKNLLHLVVFTFASFISASAGHIAFGNPYGLTAVQRAIIVAGTLLFIIAAAFMAVRIRQMPDA